VVSPALATIDGRVWKHSTIVRDFGIATPGDDAGRPGSEWVGRVGGRRGMGPTAAHSPDDTARSDAYAVKTN
jgi:hypothetical protein